MAVVATLREDVDLAPSLRFSRDGTDGTRTYDINSADVDAASGAVGLPKIGDRWSLAYPTLYCVDVRLSFRGGSNAFGTNEGGWHRAVVSYQTPRGGGGIPPGIAFTAIVVGSTSTHIMYPIGRAAGTPPIRSGKGANVEDAIVEARVYTYPSPAQYDLYLSLLSHVNTFPLRLPNVLGFGGAYEVPVGSARYRGYELEQRTLLCVIHRFVLKYDHLLPYDNEDADGNALGDPLAVQVYETADLRVLI